MEKWRDLLAGRTAPAKWLYCQWWVLASCQEAAEHLHLTSSLSLESHQLKVLGVKRGSAEMGRLLEQLRFVTSLNFSSPPSLNIKC